MDPPSPADACTEDHPVIVKLAWLVLLTGVKRRATEIHVQPGEECVRVRYRVDGVMEDAAPLSWSFAQALIDRLKVMSSLHVAERRRPQDYHLAFSFEGRHYDFAVSTLPCVHGERIAFHAIDRRPSPSSR